MLDEEMDHIIRDAAANHHPPYNDKAWEMMEKKLDKHLPQKRDRRKFIFFLLFFLLLGGAVLFTVFQSGTDQNRGDKQALANEKTAGQTTALSQQHDEQANADDPGTGLLEEGENILPGATTQKPALPGNSTAVATVPFTEGPGTSTPGPGVQPAVKNGNTKNDLSKQQDIAFIEKENPGKNNKPVYDRKGRTNARILAALPTTDVVNNPIPGVKDKSSIYMENKPTPEVTNKPSNEMANYENGKENKNKGVKKNTNGKLNIMVTAPGQENNEDEIKPTVSVPGSEPELKTKAEENTETIFHIEEAKAVKEKDSANTGKITLAPPGKKKPNKNIAGNFGITVSAGPDMSFISLKKPGKITMTYGAGISYHFAKRFTVRSGFYVSRKKYTSTPEQYHGVIYPNLTEIGADCKVYEIPVSLGYHFWQGKNHNWFGNVGLSSFLMKKEDYDYRYKTPTGQVYNYKHSVSNENEHYFAVLTLSGGYQYHFSRRISLQAEPYVQLPLAGVGLGKIKLNSSGILFTLTVKPFAK